MELAISNCRVCTRGLDVIDVDSDPPNLRLFHVSSIGTIAVLPIVDCSRSAVHCNPTKVNVVIGDGHHSRNGKSIKHFDALLFDQHQYPEKPSTISTSLFLPSAVVILQTGFLAAFQDARSSIQRSGITAQIYETMHM